MIVLVIGWIAAMWIVLSLGSKDSEAIVGLQFITMVAGVLLIGGAGMLNML